MSESDLPAGAPEGTTHEHGRNQDLFAAAFANDDVSSRHHASIYRGCDEIINNNKHRHLVKQLTLRRINQSKFKQAAVKVMLATGFISFTKESVGKAKEATKTVMPKAPRPVARAQTQKKLDTELARKGLQRWKSERKLVNNEEPRLIEELRAIYRPGTQDDALIEEGNEHL